ncbi:hypothetical protein RIF29_08696 [Crotalaria pallida]|uniref:Uncharacterized protein n=1 Tax=Crotalaria pallida TaxID=3830 RepID=A0AAN9IHH0_CROPI
MLNSKNPDLSSCSTNSQYTDHDSCFLVGRQLRQYLPQLLTPPPKKMFQYERVSIFETTLAAFHAARLRAVTRAGI